MAVMFGQPPAFLPYGPVQPQGYLGMGGQQPWGMPPPQPTFFGGMPPPQRGYKRGSGLKNFFGGNVGGNVPNLHQLQRDNRKKAKKHYKSSFGQTPRRSVPRAPEHNLLINVPGSVLSTPGGVGFHAVTPNPFLPGLAWKNGYGTVDKEAAELGKSMGLDLFGTNAGRITETVDTEGDGEGCQSDDDPFGFELQTGDEGEEGPVPASARARIDEQAAYIQQLEEQNLNLVERLFIAEQQAKELQAKLDAQAPGEQQGASHLSEDEEHSHSHTSCES